MINRTIEFSASAFRRQVKSEIEDCWSIPCTVAKASEFHDFAITMYRIDAITKDELGEFSTYIHAVETCHKQDIEDRLTPKEAKA